MVLPGKLPPSGVGNATMRQTRTGWPNREQDGPVREQAGATLDAGGGVEGLRAKEGA
jgi:hypothetical protein